jgi:hypothetical protein
MIPHHIYYQLAIVGLLWLCIMLHYVWPSRGAVSPQPSVQPAPPQVKRKRSDEPRPFAGLTQRPHGALCEHDANHPEPQPPRRPDPMTQSNRRPCTIDPSMHFCPHAGCDYQGWLGLGNLRANGHPSGGLWRQLYCRACHGYFLETHGTIFHGKRQSVELLVRVLACLAEGLGIRATARVFEVAPNIVLQWLVEAAEQLQAFTRSFLCDVHVEQLQLDEWYAVLRLDIRQRVAAIGRRVNTLCQGEAGLLGQLVLFQVYHNFVLPHASLRQALAEPIPTNGSGSAKVWRPCSPAMAAGLTDHVWSLKEVLCYRVPP